MRFNDYGLALMIGDAVAAEATAAGTTPIILFVERADWHQRFRIMAIALDDAPSKLRVLR